MIRINVSLLIEKSENRKPLIDAATELTEYSLHDKGCISYEVFSSLTRDDSLMIVETWQSRADLEQHMNAEHFTRLVPRLQELSTMTMEEFEF